jgi:hypothetical protein
VYIYCDFGDDIFAKKLFDLMDVPIYDYNLPSMLIVDYMQLDTNNLLSGEIAKSYHFPANSHYI